MRPHDIPILLKIVAKNEEHWMMKDLAMELEISPSEVSESLNRSVLAGLIAPDKKRLMKQALLSFLEHGLKYVYPQQRGGSVRGIPAAYAARPLNEMIVNDAPLVWAHRDGKMRGESIEPLYPKLPNACLKDDRFYELISLIDVLRVGRVRERTLAMNELRKRII